MMVEKILHALMGVIRHFENLVFIRSLKRELSLLLFAELKKMLQLLLSKKIKIKIYVLSTCVTHDEKFIF